MNQLTDDQMSAEEEREIMQAFQDGIDGARSLFRVANNQNMSPRQLAVASMLTLTIVSKHDGLALENVLEMVKTIWHNTEFSPEDLH